MTDVTDGLPEQTEQNRTHPIRVYVTPDEAALFEAVRIQYFPELKSMSTYLYLIALQHVKSLLESNGLTVEEFTATLNKE